MGLGLPFRLPSSPDWGKPLQPPLHMCTRVVMTQENSNSDAWWEGTQKIATGFNSAFLIIKIKSRYPAPPLAPLPKAPSLRTYPHTHLLFTSSIFFFSMNSFLGIRNDSICKFLNFFSLNVISDVFDHIWMWSSGVWLFSIVMRCSTAAHTIHTVQRTWLLRRRRGPLMHNAPYFT